MVILPSGQHRSGHHKGHGSSHETDSSRLEPENADIPSEKHPIVTKLYDYLTFIRAVRGFGRTQPRGNRRRPTMAVDRPENDDAREDAEVDAIRP
jgi:hypothetical protein